MKMINEKGNNDFNYVKYVRLTIYSFVLRPTKKVFSWMYEESINTNKRCKFLNSITNCNYSGSVISYVYSKQLRYNLLKGMFAYLGPHIQLFHYEIKPNILFKINRHKVTLYFGALSQQIPGCNKVYDLYIFNHSKLSNKLWIYK